MAKPKYHADSTRKHSPPQTIPSSPSRPTSDHAVPFGAYCTVTEETLATIAAAQAWLKERLPGTVAADAAHLVILLSLRETHSGSLRRLDQTRSIFDTES